MIANLLAHQGGWDEILFVAAPIAVFAALLAMANRRASLIEQQRRQDGDPPDGDPEPPGRPGASPTP